MTATLSSDTGTDLTSPTLTELLFPDFESEHAATRRLLERVPAGHGGWQPHDRSRTLAQLATHIAELPHRGVAVLTMDEMDATTRAPGVPLDTAEALVALHETGVARVQAALAQADLEMLSANWTLRRGDQVLLRGPRRVLIRTMMMSHIIHHRAQLGVYFRLLGVRVPGVYGPTADDIPAGSAA